MGTRYLIDTNILIYHLKDELPEPDFLRNLTPEIFNISIITKIEFLGWNKHTDEGFKMATELINLSSIRHLTESIITKTISLKRNFAIKLPDAIIAATCLEDNLTLVTRNEEDFKKIPDIHLFNPFSN